VGGVQIGKTAVRGKADMTDTKLQELIDTLKRQGVQGGEEASRRILDEANEKAKEIVGRARSEADAIVAQAKEEADKSLRQLHSSLEIAASQLLTDLKRAIEQNLLALPLGKKITENLLDLPFLKDLMTTCVREYVKHPERSDLSILVSKEQIEKLSDFVMELIKSQPGAREGDSLKLKLESGGVAFGFIIGTSDGVVRLDFTDEAFLELFLRYLTPRFRGFFKTVDFKGPSGK
jgi:V/A-type H+-transporting ATPase subunit E